MTCLHNLESHRNRERSSGKMVALALAGLIVPVTANAQTTYHDPKGRYDLQIPEGWTAAPDNGVDQIIVRKGAVQATVLVSQQHKDNGMTAKEADDETVKEFYGQCPTTQVRKKGAVTLAGEPGIYTLLTCSDSKSPAVAEAASVLTDNTVLVQFTMVAPLAKYYDNLPLLDGIRDSLRVTGATIIAVQKGTDSTAVTELDRACTVGVFAQEDCARRMGILLGKEGAQDGTPQKPPSGAVYRDPSGRFSLHVPEGWSAKAEGDNGVLGVQLRSGTNWINVMAADPAASASEVVLNQEQKVALRSNSSRKPPFGPAGLIQVFGNGLEVTYDSFKASSAQGDPIESYIAGVGDISGTGHNFLLLIASIGAEQGEKSGGTFLSVAQSIHLAAH